MSSDQESIPAAESGAKCAYTLAIAVNAVLAAAIIASEERRFNEVNFPFRSISSRQFLTHSPLFADEQSPFRSHASLTALSGKTASEE